LIACVARLMSLLLSVVACDIFHPQSNSL